MEVYRTIFLISCCLHLYHTQTCNQHVWCNDCIAADKACAWCQDQIFRGDRCSVHQDLHDNGCIDIFYPNNTFTKIQDDTLRDGGKNIDPIQLRPQHVKLQLRRGKSQSFNMKYRVANNVPIDMYFVLDFSNTMRNRIQKLANLTESLIKGLQKKFSTNIYIGFGSFLDKPIQPFHVTTPKNLENPCHMHSGSAKCEPAYGYKHKRRLGQDIAGFIQTVKNANTSVNNDPMEGGLDAIVQAAVCPSIIGWREQSRRVMVYISDGGFHFAGDGKLAGIDTPCDGLCHMDYVPETKEYIYSKSTQQDYPSLGHVAKVLDDNNINAFFVVSGNDSTIYEKFTDMVKQADTTTMDNDGASTIVDEITEYYTALSAKLTIAANNIPDEIEVSIASNCGSGAISTINAKTSTKDCKFLERSMTIDFNVTVTLTKCPSTRDKKGGAFTIFPVGIQETLQIQMDYICDCECLVNETLDEHCSEGNGTYECGACRCNSGRSGELCQCDNSEEQSESHFDDDNCKKDNSSDVICETRGSCVCGQCQCNKNYEGKFCECDMNQCYGGKQTEYCSGHGQCQCGECQCEDGYYSEHCQCPPNSVCLGPNGLECSGNGHCNCGQCVCTTTDYKGEFCSECPRCERCRKCGYKECVDCLGKHNHRDNETIFTDCAMPCKDLNMSHIQWLDRFQTGQTPCGRFDAANCEISYAVVCDETENSDPYLQIAKTKQCPNPPDPVLIAMPLLAGIIGVGILLLIIWKILTSFYDKIEYARFEHEVSNPKWTKGENPIYNSPVTTNQNPTFTGHIDD